MKVAQILVFIAGIGFIMARETSRAINRLDNHSGTKDEFISVVETRKRKPYHDLFFFMGGLQSLVTFVVIKIKIVLIVVTIIGFVGLALKLFGVLKYTSYLYKNDYPPIGPPVQEFSSYPGPPLSPHSSSHQDHETYSNDWPSYSEHYARSSSQLPKSLNITEIGYSLANLDRDDCRARLVCEFQIILSRSPFLRYLTRHVVTRQKLPGSRSNSEECSAYYAKCLGSTERRLIRRRKRRSRGRVSIN